MFVGLCISEIKICYLVNSIKIPTSQTYISFELLFSKLLAILRITSRLGLKL